MNTRLLYVYWKRARINSLDSDSTKMGAGSQNGRLVQRLKFPMFIQTAVLLVWTKVDRVLTLIDVNLQKY